MAAATTVVQYSTVQYSATAATAATTATAATAAAGWLCDDL